MHIRGNPKPEAVELPREGPAISQSTSASSIQEPVQDGTGVAALAPFCFNTAVHSHIQLHRLDLIHRSRVVGAIGVATASHAMSPHHG